ncbi:uncharacterized protein MYCFIDRAFT_187947 [Pseudocercospora fijiensis CIRAD86]|uniref:Oxidoreductase N-terminal domain-containing protein n=1 Tax=Pseudocercospora fijiensis (strain CIRAD86) TaxID=383855 RepID=M2YY50_PSEFD|nr:uncharacterized protein MYCFIDRAFT_187947 [Pseudocercospora fijiensis CIRAD86]EME82595.1 hypothetical protein MYCFIDRAFT_187947 [Pseudocercospora fijiensis CIRAD86]
MSLPSTYKSIHLATRPKDHITPETFTVRQHPTPSPSSLKDGEVLFQPNYCSLDPAMRGWLNDTRSYIPPVKLGAIMRGESVGRIIAYLHSGLRDEELLLKDNLITKITLPPNRRPSNALGVLGITGLTAYFRILNIGKVKARDFVVVSRAAGATGSILVEELGFDRALNYKGKNFTKEFREATKRFRLIDMFFDNVGGEVLDLALSRAKEHSRFVIYRGILQYNSREIKGPRNYLIIVSIRIRIEGFVVFNFKREYKKARKDLAL